MWRYAWKDSCRIPCHKDVPILFGCCKLISRFPPCGRLLVSNFCWLPARDKPSWPLAGVGCAFVDVAVIGMQICCMGHGYVFKKDVEARSTPGLVAGH